MTNFWTHRCSNDIIYIVKDEPTVFLQSFGNFLQNLPTGVRVYRFSYGSNYIDIDPNWNKLISIEIQTKKWLTDKCDDLHVKFYFEQEYAEQLIGKFSDQYINNITSIGEYWSDKDVGNADAVFKNVDNGKTVLLLDNIGASLAELKDVSLPWGKDVYIIRKDYAKAIKTFKGIFLS